MPTPLQRRRAASRHMPRLADLQAGMRQAVTLADPRAVASLLVGGADPAKRLAIHQRHYEASLVRAVCEKFPATAWLIGADVVADAARAYVRMYPPRRPCIAEYAEGFPAFLAGHERALALPYVQSFADLERHVGQVSISIEGPPMTWSEIAAVGSDALLSARVALQPGVRYLRAAWAVDQLMTMFLRDAAPEEFLLTSADTCIEIRGARGALHVASIDPAAFVFRSALRDGRPLGEAAETALDGDSAFDAGKALMELVTAGLVAGVITTTKGPACERRS